MSRSCAELRALFRHSVCVTPCQSSMIPKMQLEQAQESAQARGEANEQNARWVRCEMASQSSLLAVEDPPTSRLGQRVDPWSDDAGEPEPVETLGSLLACIEAEIRPLRRSLWGDEIGAPAFDEARSTAGGADAPAAPVDAASCRVGKRLEAASTRSGDGVRAEPHAEEEAPPPPGGAGILPANSTLAGGTPAPQAPEPEPGPRRDEQSAKAQAEERGPEVPGGDARSSGRADGGSGIDPHQAVAEILAELRGDKEIDEARAGDEATPPPAPQPEPGVAQPLDDSPSESDGGEKEETATRVARPASRKREAISASPRSSPGISALYSLTLLYPLMLLVFAAGIWLTLGEVTRALARVAAGRPAEQTAPARVAAVPPAEQPALAISEEEQRICDGFLGQIRQGFVLSEPSDEAAARWAATSFLQFTRARQAGQKETAETQARMARDWVKGLRSIKPAGEGETTEPKGTATEWATALLEKVREADAKARPAAPGDPTRPAS